MIHFLHTFEPNPILFSLGPLVVHWYGVLIVMGIIAGLAVVTRLGKTVGITKDEIYNLAFYIIIFGLLGARLYAVLLEFDFYFKHPGQILAVWNGGLAIHGALLGGAATLFVYVQKKRLPFWPLADIIAVAIPLGQAIGRWGNYFNQELFGTPTHLPWGIPIRQIHRPYNLFEYRFFHPTFLYESILNMLNFILLWWIFNNRRRLRIRTGVLFFIYLINYAVIRIIMEFFRVDQTPLVWGVRLPIAVSLILLAVGAGGVYFFQFRRIDRAKG